LNFGALELCLHLRKNIEIKSSSFFDLKKKGGTKWVSLLPGEPAAAEVAKHSALHWSHVGPQSVHET